ncbi:MAG: 50S ribosome-binding GTPase [Candidatus Omnitrophica bacterium]|nr:50S ribosome-binding GTPase [Candidatus Omnitrophota bacterium]
MTNILSFVIVGHVDHGKSTLVGRLLYDTDSLSSDKIEEMRKRSTELGHDIEFAYLLDHLEEERVQGITIDTTQVFFKSKKRRYVIIDAPGHVEFVKNMVTGASQANTAILIIDAAQGVQEQTRRHAYILSLLGLRGVTVVINKMDLVGFDKCQFESIEKDITDFLNRIDVHVNVCIPIAAKTGDNVVSRSNEMNWYKGPTTMEALDAVEIDIRRDSATFIFPVQDVFKLDDERVILGTIESGSIRENEYVSVLPTLQKTKINKLKVFGREIAEASAGESIGVITQAPVFLDRGMVLVNDENDVVCSDTIQAHLFWMHPKSYALGDKVDIRIATQEVRCVIEMVVKKINSSTLELINAAEAEIKNLEVAQVKIKTKKAVMYKRFQDNQGVGRFVLVRDGSICAGGIII